MKSIITLMAFFFIHLNSWAQPESTVQETAKAFMQSGDYSNATLVLTRALQENSNQPSISKDLALCYLFQRDYNKSLETIKPLLDNPNSDDQCYQIAGQVYKALDQPKEIEKLYRKGLKKFPESGPLYAEMGAFLWGSKIEEAITYWEKGIRLDPAYSKNYYHAAKYYSAGSNKIWCIIYAEIFVNSEPAGALTLEIKDILLDSYKKLFTAIPLEADAREKNPFVLRYYQAIKPQNSLASQGIDLASLSMIRTRFILEWNRMNENPMPFKLFDYHTQLLREGLFEAYQQWLFGPSTNLTDFQQWTSTNQEVYQQFTRFQKNLLFKMPAGEYYH
jgi:tetratricopeptide (TPR) repeat protein